jgi:hypothetical protein
VQVVHRVLHFNFPEQLAKANIKIPQGLLLCRSSHMVSMVSASGEGSLLRRTAGTAIADSGNLETEGVFQ